MTSPFLSASPSPAPVCSIFGSPNRLDLWLDLCLKLLFSWTKSVECDKRCCGWHLSQIRRHFVRFWEVGHPLITKKTCPEHTNMWSHFFPCKCNACKGCLLHKPHLECHHQRRWQLRALASFKYMLRARHREASVRSLNYTCAMHTQPSNRLSNTCKEKWKRKTQTMPRDRRCTLAAGDAPTVPCL